ncbi:MAG: hypothetical protein HOQ05_12120 [Corynebacteriales bacterium]|nr:hypothetical protein [Mycobacteriales bacterium]
MEDHETGSPRNGDKTSEQFPQWGDPGYDLEAPPSFGGRAFAPARRVLAGRYAVSGLIGAASATLTATALVLSVASFWGTFRSSAENDKQLKEFGGYLDVMLSGIAAGDPSVVSHFNDAARAEILRAAQLPASAVDDQVMLNKAMEKIYRDTSGQQRQSLNQPQARAVIGQGHAAGGVGELASVTFRIRPVEAAPNESVVVPISRTDDPDKPFTVDSAQILTAGVQALSPARILTTQHLSTRSDQRPNSARTRH